MKTTMQLCMLSLLAMPFLAMSSEEGSLRNLRKKCDVYQAMGGLKKDKVKAGDLKYFNRISVFPICTQIDAACNTDEETVAEIVVATDDGMTLIYTDSEQEQLGFVDITDPANPAPLGVVALDGEPTSVAMKGDYALVGINTSEDYVDTSGQLVAIDVTTMEVVGTWDLGGQPDSVSVSPDGTFAVIAIENERDEDLGDGIPPQMPAGYVVVVDVSSDSLDDWSPSIVDVTGLDGILFPEDPEPEFVAINDQNLAVVTLQENNGIVLIDLPTLSVVGSFSAGTVDLEDVDIEEEGIISPTGSLDAVPREPDGVTFINDVLFATADEGDMDGGSRGFTIFDVCGDVVYGSGNFMEHKTIQVGHYPDERSENKGNEPENVAFGTYDGRDFLFVNSERSSLVFVYDLSARRGKKTVPKFVQVLPAGVGPEGGYTIPDRNLLVVASEKDARDDKMRSIINIYEYGADEAQYPTIESAVKKGVPIGWGAMSGLSPYKKKKNALLAVEDSFYKESRFFQIDLRKQPALINKATKLMDKDGVLAGMSTYGEFDADDLAALVNDDGTVNLDLEGIAYNGKGIVVAHEGRGTVGDEDRPVESLSMLIEATMKGTITNVITLPDEWNDKQLRFGFEGVAFATIKRKDYYVAITQRAWGDDENPAVFVWDIEAEEWAGYVYYPLEEPISQYGGWVGLSDITYKGDGKFLVLERDNQGGPDAAIKKIFEIDLSDIVSRLFDMPTGTTIEKTEVLDLFDVMATTGGLAYEKFEGLAFTDSGVYIINDNDGVDDNSGETQLLNVGML